MTVRGERIGPARIAGPDGYASAWGLTADRLRALVALPELAPAPGDPVVVMPGRDLCYVTTTGDEAGIESALDTAWKTYTEEPDRPISPAAYVVTDDGLVPYRAPQPGSLANKVHRALAYFEFREHQAQYEWLKENDHANRERVEDALGRPLRLSGAGNAGLARGDESRLARNASIVLVEPDDCYLVQPAEEVILIEDASTGMLAVPRAELDRICGHRLEQSRLLPLGGTIMHGWPSAEEIAQLQAVGEHMDFPTQ